MVKKEECMETIRDDDDGRMKGRVMICILYEYTSLKQAYCSIKCPSIQHCIPSLKPSPSGAAIRAGGVEISAICSTWEKLDFGF